MSRWLVGSSIMKKSASLASICAMATRLTSPPESSFIFCPKSGRSRLVRNCLTLRLYSSRCPVSISAVSSALDDIIWSNIPFSGSKLYSCSRKEMRISFRKVIFPPESDLSFPASIFRSDVLPVPFGAIRAILSPSLMLNPICSKSTFGPYDLEIFSIWR